MYVYTNTLITCASSWCFFSAYEYCWRNSFAAHKPEQVLCPLCCMNCLLSSAVCCMNCYTELCRIMHLFLQLFDVSYSNKMILIWTIYLYLAQCDYNREQSMQHSVCVVYSITGHYKVKYKQANLQVECDTKTLNALDTVLLLFMIIVL